MLTGYLRQRRRTLLAFFLFGGIFAAAFALYQLPLRAVAYPFVLCAAAGAVLLTLDYRRVLRQHRRLELLRQLQADGVVSAVVSNKPDYAVKTLSEQYFPGLLATSAGAKDGVRKKPCPDSVFAVVQQLGAEALRAVYIGDSEVDVATARNAGMPCISVSWGFRDRNVLVSAGAETICDDMDALYRALREG